MKKALVLLLILAVAGGLFAQELNLSGYVTTGLQVQMGDAHGDEVFIRADEDDVPTGIQARLHGTVTGDDWGVKLTLGADMGGEELTAVGLSTLVSVRNAYGWMDFADGLVKATVGLMDDSVWGTGGELDANVSQGIGARFEVQPLGDKLNIGAMLRFPTNALYFNYSNAGIDFGTGYDYDKGELSGLTIANFLKASSFGVSYTDADLMNLYATASLGLSPYGKTASYKTDYETDVDMRLLFAVSLNPIEALSVLINGQIDFPGSTEVVPARTQTRVNLWQEFGYDINSDISAYLKLNEYIGQNFDGDDFDGFYGAQIYIGGIYAVTPEFVAGLEVEVDLATKDGDLGLSAIVPALWCKYTIGNTWLKFSYALITEMEGYHEYTDKNGQAISTGINHSIRLIMGTSF